MNPCRSCWTARAALFGALVGLCPSAILAEEPATIPLKSLPPNSRVAIWGDSITEMTLYPQFVEIYLLACAGRKDVKVCMFGHSGERQGALLSRRSDLDAWKPTVVSFNYGMNDTEYKAYSAAKGAAYDKTTRAVLIMLRGKGIEHRIVVGPDAVDDLFARDNPAAFFQGAPSGGLTAAQAQNVTLRHFRDFNCAAAIETGSAFADVYNRMTESYAKAVKVLGPNYGMGPNGSVHPSPNGHFSIAHELLKALACKGDIGTIEVDMKGGAAASPGHKVVSSSGGVVVLDSEKYPFCYNYDAGTAGNPMSVASIVPFTPFSQELNRLIVKVTNLDAASANVTWGSQTKSFSREQLAKGINLTEHFAHTPFDGTFARVMAAITDKEDFENYMIKLTANYNANDNGGNIDDNMLAVHDEKDAAVKALIVPVRHTIVIVPAGSSETMPPVITGAMMAYATVGVPFSYRISALRSPTSFAATKLPKGLSISAATGEITGTPSETGVGRVTLTATNGHGAASGKLTLAVMEPVPQRPVMTSRQTASGTVGEPFTYRMTATNSPAHYFATSPGDKGTVPPASSLPAGLSYDTKTGVISGVPKAAGVYSIQTAAMNAGGVSAAMIKLTVEDK